MSGRWILLICGLWLAAGTCVVTWEVRKWQQIGAWNFVWRKDLPQALVLVILWPMLVLF